MGPVSFFRGKGPRVRFVIGLVLLVGCVDGFTGANVQLDLSAFTPNQASDNRAPVAMAELPAQTHFTLWRVDTEGGADVFTALQQFEVHRVADIGSACFIDVGDQVPFPGVHVTEFARKMGESVMIPDITNPPAGATEQDRIDAATAVQRANNVQLLATSPEGVKVITTASPTLYPPVDADCTGTGLPPPTCRDDVSNARRLAICSEIWAADPLKFEGTDRVLTAPLNGTTFGFVIGLNRVNNSPVGGAQFLVADPLDAPRPDAFAITIDPDGTTVPGTIFLYGVPTMTTRGVTHVRMTSPLNPMATAVLAIFTDLSEDEVDF